MLVVNVEKTLAISFHTTQNKNPVLPHVINEGRDIPYNTETKFLGVHIHENMKLNNHIKYKVKYKLLHILHVYGQLHRECNESICLRNYVFACFHFHVRYDLTLWGGGPGSIKIF
jgi:hypothetical protein